MKYLNSTALKVDLQGKVWVLDQTSLPHHEQWLESSSIEDMYHIIKTLKVRGAPLIGVAAALALAQYAEQGASHAELLTAGARLKASRPTAVNLAYCVDRVLACYAVNHDRDAVIQEAERIFEEDALLSQKIAEHAARYIHPDMRILTHCNTGGLVTTGIGTALGAIILAHQQGKRPFVYADETRPLLQGGRLTAWECVKNGIPHQILCDNAAASLMHAGQVDAVFVGADRIAQNGDCANKVGTYNVALLAAHFNIPFYVLAPHTTLDLNCQSGADIIIEHRSIAEVKGAHGVVWSPLESDAYNPAFDVTPAKFVTQIVLDTGVFTQNMSHSMV